MVKGADLTQLLQSEVGRGAELRAAEIAKEQGSVDKGFGNYEPQVLWEFREGGDFSFL